MSLRFLATYLLFVGARHARRHRLDNDAILRDILFAADAQPALRVQLVPSLGGPVLKKSKS